MKLSEKFSIFRIKGNEKIQLADSIIREYALTIFLNNQELVTLICSPSELKNLVLGYLVSEELVKNQEEIKNMVLEEKKGLIWVETTNEINLFKGHLPKRIITSGCAGGVTLYALDGTAEQYKEVSSEVKTSPAEVLSLVSQVHQQAQIYRATGGTHCAALCESKNILVFSEDIGRHNAIDKVFGKALVEDFFTADKIIITSGRVSSEILLKVAKRNIPVIASISAPTHQSVKLAHKMKITLIGFARGKRMNIYTHDWRIE